jgi:methylglyoxal/glyoxal reductase
MAEKYGKTAAQILIRWNLQHGNVVIPKSTSHHRIKENWNVFDFNISEHDMTEIDKLGVKNWRCVAYNGAERHPNYPFK